MKLPSTTRGPRGTRQNKAVVGICLAVAASWLLTAFVIDPSAAHDLSLNSADANGTRLAMQILTYSFVHTLRDVRYLLVNLMMLTAFAWPASCLDTAVFLRLFSFGAIFSGLIWVAIWGATARAETLAGAYPSLMALWAGMLVLNPTGWGRVKSVNVRGIVAIVGGIFAYVAVAGCLADDTAVFSASLAGILGGSLQGTAERVVRRYQSQHAGTS